MWRSTCAFGFPEGVVGLLTTGREARLEREQNQYDEEQEHIDGDGATQTAKD